MLNKNLLIAATALCGFAVPAAAHSPWLLPSATILSDTNSWVTVDAGIATDPFNADHQPMSTDGIKVWLPDGSPGQIQNAAKGRYRSVFDVQIDKPGTWRIGTTDANVSGTFKVGEETWSVGRRRGGGGPGGPGGGERPAGAPAPGGAQGGPGGEGAGRPPMKSVPTVADIPADATDVNLTESLSSNSVFVTAGAPTTTVFRPANKGLEMVPVTHPDEVVANEAARFRFLVDGKPAANLKVDVVPGGKRFRQADTTQQLATGADGVVTVKWPAAGYYWLSASLTDDRPAAPRAARRRMTYIMTLEVPAP